MSCQINIINQVVINFLTQNTKENNIEDYIKELKTCTNICFK